MTLVERVHTHEGFHERDGDTYAELVSIQYGDGPVLYPPPNRHRVVWETDRFGALRRVHDVAVLNKGRRAEQRYRADFRAHSDRTQITVGTGKRKEETSLVGMVLLRVLTRNGQLVVEY